MLIFNLAPWTSPENFDGNNSKVFRSKIDICTRSTGGVHAYVVGLVSNILLW